ncbi:hypothetical protein M7775_02000 [Sporomusa sphaeroides DSM 2875]|uniref:hypothetical protein n=1 Tax=Sporomusa sphaeroides TaxID=47679 RepID=UPI002030B072|nr:hypothetical protein [Sporomusa sphaeroides]MCM0757340.1 hypothetical protein [Sporomusa sphaeroides DSM 2875]
MSDEQLGTDIAFNKDFNTVPTGDTTTVTGRTCLGQDLVNRMTTPLGDLWCHQKYGFDIYKYVQLENTEINRLSFVQDIAINLEKDPRVVPGSATATILSWDMKKIKSAASVQPVTGGNRLNMVFGYSSNEITGQVVS